MDSNQIAHLKEIACNTVDGRKTDLLNISNTIGEFAEVSFEEKQSHDFLVKFLKQEGFEVQEKTPLDTSFIAKYGNPKGIKIGVCCEYDALPEIGHACGHNLITEAGIGAALGKNGNKV